MRSREYLTRGITVIRYELSFPDDFQSETKPTKLLFSPDQSSFTVPGVLSENLQLIRAAQIENDQIEYGFVRVQLGEATFALATPLSPLKGTNAGLSYDVYHKKFYEKPSVFTDWTDLQPIEIVDFIHSHPWNREYDPAISNLFSYADIKEMGSKFGQRYWLLGPDGGASCLIRSGIQVFEDDFAEPAYKYAHKSKAELTYSEALRNFIECIQTCNLRLYRSPDLVNFCQQSDGRH